MDGAAFTFNWHIQKAPTRDGKISPETAWEALSQEEQGFVLGQAAFQVALQEAFRETIRLTAQEIAVIAAEYALPESDSNSPFSPAILESPHASKLLSKIRKPLEAGGMKSGPEAAHETLRHLIGPDAVALLTKYKPHFSKEILVAAVESCRFACTLAVREAAQEAIQALARKYILKINLYLNNNEVLEDVGSLLSRNSCILVCQELLRRMTFALAAEAAYRSLKKYPPLPAEDIQASLAGGVWKFPSSREQETQLAWLRERDSQLRETTLAAFENDLKKILKMTTT